MATRLIPFEKALDACEFAIRESLTANDSKLWPPHGYTDRQRVAYVASLNHLLPGLAKLPGVLQPAV